MKAANHQKGDESVRVQSVRNVGSKRGYPYYAFGIYEATQARDGHWYWRLVKSGPEFRSDMHNRTAFEDVPIISGVRHGSPAPDPGDKLACDQWLNSRR